MILNMGMDEANAIGYIAIAVVLAVYVIAAATVQIKTGKKWWPMNHMGDSDDR